VTTAVYASLAQYKGEIGETSSDNDARHMADLAEASRVIDRLCRVPAGRFAPTAAGVARTFDVSSAQAMRMSLPPVYSVSAVKTDEDGDRTFETTLASTDYRLYPLDGPPYTSIRVDDAQGNYTFPVGQARVQITGQWGEALTVPLPIQRATRLLAGRYRVRPNTPEALMAGTNNMMALGQHDPDVLTILRDGGYINVSAVFA